MSKQSTRNTTHMLEEKHSEFAVLHEEAHGIIKLILAYGGTPKANFHTPCPAVISAHDAFTRLLLMLGDLHKSIAGLYGPDSPFHVGLEKLSGLFEQIHSANIARLSEKVNTEGGYFETSHADVMGSFKTVNHLLERIKDIHICVAFATEEEFKGGKLIEIVTNENTTLH